MCHFSIEHFSAFMFLNYGIEVDEESVGEETVLLYKEELDEKMVTKELLDVVPEMVLYNAPMTEKKKML